MQQLSEWARNGLALVGVLALGVWLGSGTKVSASSNGAGNSVFQLTGVSPESSLLVYQPENKTIYVYQAATTGNSAVQCSFKFQLDRPGEVIRRVPCAVPNLNP